jgi:hypothetical protein
MRDDGSARAAVMPGTFARNPQWSPDGARLLLSVYRGDSALESMWVDLAARRRVDDDRGRPARQGR